MQRNDAPVGRVPEYEYHKVVVRGGWKNDCKADQKKKSRNEEQILSEYRPIWYVEADWPPFDVTRPVDSPKTRKKCKWRRVKNDVQKGGNAHHLREAPFSIPGYPPHPQKEKKTQRLFYRKQSKAAMYEKQHLHAHPWTPSIKDDDDDDEKQKAAQWSLGKAHSQKKAYKQWVLVRCDVARFRLPPLSPPLMGIVRCKIREEHAVRPM
jgi:hypothetical protein